MASSSWLTYFKSQLWPSLRWTSKIIIIMQSKFNICERYNSLNLKCPPKPTCQRLDPQGVTREVINHWETEFVGSPLSLGGVPLKGIMALWSFLFVPCLLRWAVLCYFPVVIHCLAINPKIGEPTATSETVSQSNVFPVTSYYFRYFVIVTD